MFNTFDNSGFLPFLLACGWPLTDFICLNARAKIIMQCAFAPSCEVSALVTFLMALIL